MQNRYIPEPGDEMNLFDFKIYRVYIRILLALVIFVPALSISIHFESPLLMKESLAFILIAILLVSWSFNLLLGGYRIQINKSFIWPLTAFIIWCWLSLSFSSTLFTSLRDVCKVFLGFAFFLFLMDYFRTRDNIRYWIKCLAVAASTIAFFSILQFFNVYIDTSFGGLLGDYNYPWFSLTPNGTSARNTLAATIGHNNGVASLLLVAIPLCLTQLFGSTHRRGRFFWSSAVILQMLTILIVQTRITWGALFIALTIFGIILIRGPFRNNAVIFTRSAWIAGIIIFLLGNVLILNSYFGFIPFAQQKSVGFYDRIDQTLDFKRLTGDTRFRASRVALEMFREHPYTGTGLGTYKYHSAEYQGKIFERHPDTKLNPTPVHSSRVHNEYIQVLAELGIPGFILFIYLLIYPIGLLIKKWSGISYPPDSLLLNGAIASYIGICFQAIADFPFHVVTTVIPFLGLPAVILMLCRAKREEPADEVNSSAIIRSNIVKIAVVGLIICAFIIGWMNIKSLMANFYMGRGRNAVAFTSNDRIFYEELKKIEGFVNTYSIWPKPENSNWSAEQFRKLDEYIKALKDHREDDVPVQAPFAGDDLSKKLADLKLAYKDIEERISRNRGIGFESIDDALEWQPHDGEIWYTKGGLLRQSKQYHESIMAFNKALEEFQVKEIYFQLGEALSYLGDWQNAHSNYVRAVWMFNGYGDAIRRLQIIWSKIDLLNIGGEQLQRLREKKHSCLDLNYLYAEKSLRQNKYQEALNSLNELLELYGNDNTRRNAPKMVYLTMGRVLMQSGKTDDFLDKLLPAALKSYPGDRELKILEAECYLRMTEPAKAIDVLAMQGGGGAESALVYQLWGDALYKQKKYDESIKMLNRALSVDEFSSENFAQLAKLRIKLEDYEQARQDAFISINLDPGKPDAYAHLARLAELSNPPDWDLAASEIKQALKLRKHRNYYSQLIDYYMYSGNWDTAVKVIEDYLSIAPHDPNIDMRYTRALLESGRYRQAIDIVDSQIDEDMEVFSGNYYLRGFCYLKSGELEKAEADMLTFLSYVENDCNAYDRLIEIYQELGKTNQIKEIERKKQENGCGT
jgi:tetratricopeptide (TPR) repeat protein/O-antigen ligase